MVGNTAALPQLVQPDLQWMRVLSACAGGLRPALFLDRDGVLIEERNYLADPAGVALIAGGAGVVASARAAGWAVVVVSNQSGIGRGYLDWPTHLQIEDRMLALMAASGAGIDASLACPFHPQALPPYRGDHGWRKPRPGMLLAAADALRIDLPRSCIVGDRASDLEAGRAAGLRLAFHVATGHGARERDRVDALQRQETAMRVESLGSLADLREPRAPW